MNNTCQDVWDTGQVNILSSTCIQSNIELKSQIKGHSNK